MRRSLATLALMCLLPSPAMADETPTPPPPLTAADVPLGAAAAAGVLRRLDPFLSIVGGIEAEHVVQPADGTREDRVTTLALSRFGIRGQIAPGVYVESELEANAGPHGTSAWEGQAALQVRNQLIRLTRGRYRIDVGRITDNSSLNFFSVHVADQLLMDSYLRTTLLYAGFNRGNGVLGVVEAGPVELGLTLNAANPTSTTGSVMIGGTFPPFSRFYFAPYAQVGRDAAAMPADQYHVYLLTPSVVLNRPKLKVKAAVQGFQANTNTNDTEDARIHGFNTRATTQLVLWGGKLTPFASGAFTRNDVVDPSDGYALTGELYRSVTVGGGVDLNRVDRHGIGVQVDTLREQQGEGTIRRATFINVGGTYWLTTSTSLGLRGAWYDLREDAETFEGPVGERSLFLTVRTIL